MQLVSQLLSVFIMTVLEEEAPANYVPAAAVIRRGLALSGITGRKYRDWNKGRKKKMKLDSMSVIPRKRREIQEEIKNRDTDEKEK